MFSALKKLAQKNLSPDVSRILRNISTDIRYQLRMSSAHQKYKHNGGSSYIQNILFIAGLPKSGTTWLEKMLGELSGFQEMMIPEAVRYEKDHKGSHFFDLPDDIFTRFSQHLVLLKLHVQGSTHNKQLLAASNCKHVYMYRDLRDVAVSYYFYVKQTPWHAEYQIYKNLNVQQGLLYFSNQMLPDYIQWIDSWEKDGLNDLKLLVRYEDLRIDTEKVFRSVLEHFELKYPDDSIKKMIANNNFKKLSGGRTQGQDDKNSFFRKGISGDWINHFDEKVEKSFIENSGDFFVKHGYEKSELW